MARVLRSIEVPGGVYAYALRAHQIEVDNLVARKFAVPPIVAERLELLRRGAPSRCPTTTCLMSSDPGAARAGCAGWARAG